MGKQALIVVDVQRDFLPGGSLAVPGGDEIVEAINRLIKIYADAGNPVFVTMDSHPQDHKSFASNHEGKNPLDMIDLNGIAQVLWPDHCVMGTDGHKLADGLELPFSCAVVMKGMDAEYDSYSGFKDANGSVTPLLASLRDAGLGADDSCVDICGLATDFCVKATAIDAAEAGFRARVILDACRGVGAPPGTEAAICDMLARGIELVHSQQIIESK
jgi:nicotinamidase/pyrazinamidase